MGYLIKLIDSDFYVAEADKRDALMLILGLMTREEELGQGFSSSGPNERTHYFSWLNNAEPDEWETFEDAMDDWRFPVETDDNGNVVGINFEGQKVGQEHYLFDRIAPCVRNGSFLRIEGENGAVWDLEFDDGEVTEVPVDTEHSHFGQLYSWDDV